MASYCNTERPLFVHLIHEEPILSMSRKKHCLLAKAQTRERADLHSILGFLADALCGLRQVIATLHTLVSPVVEWVSDSHFARDFWLNP